MRGRLVVAALVAVVAGSVAPTIDRADRPRWEGTRPLSGERRTVTELRVEPVSPAGAQAVARRLVDADTVGLAATTPLVVVGSRPAVPGGRPEPRAARATAEAAVRAMGLDPAEWTSTVSGAGTEQTVRMSPKSELAVLPAPGIVVPEVLVQVDTVGVTALWVPLVRLSARPVEVLSEREALARVAGPGEYRLVSLVLVYDGSPVLRPHYDFSSPGMRPRRAGARRVDAVAASS